LPEELTFWSVLNVDNKIEDLQEELEDAAALSQKTPTMDPGPTEEATSEEPGAVDASFMSESIYEKLPSPKAKRLKAIRRKSMPILHEHFQPGSNIKELQAHNDMITALDFDVPFGTMDVWACLKVITRQSDVCRSRTT